MILKKTSITYNTNPVAVLELEERERISFSEVQTYCEEKALSFLPASARIDTNARYLVKKETRNHKIYQPFFSKKNAVSALSLKKEDSRYLWVELNLPVGSPLHFAGPCCIVVMKTLNKAS